MRDSFTLNGYGAPISFNSVDSIAIVKGPASVQGGQGRAWEARSTSAPRCRTSTNFGGEFNLEFDTQQKRARPFDVAGPLTSNVAARVSFAFDDSGSYYYDMYFSSQSLFASCDRSHAEVSASS